MVYVTLITLSYLFGSSRDLCGSAIAENCGSNRISVKGVLCSYYTLQTFLGNGRDGNGSVGHDGLWVTEDDPFPSLCISLPTVFSPPSFTIL